MLNKILSGLLLMILVGCAEFAMGQDVPSGKWWYNPKIVNELNLTKKETRQLDKLYVDSRRKLIELKSAVEREQFELDTLLGRKNINQTEVQKQFKRLEKARGDLSNERLRFVVRVREIIGYERFQQLKTSYKKWR